MDITITMTEALKWKFFTYHHDDFAPKAKESLIQSNRPPNRYRKSKKRRTTKDLRRRRILFKKLHSSRPTYAVTTIVPTRTRTARICRNVKAYYKMCKQEDLRRSLEQEVRAFYHFN